MPLDAMQIAALRTKCTDGTVTKDELRVAYAAMREARLAIPVAKGGSRTTAGKAKTAINSDDLLAQLGSLGNLGSLPL